MGSKVNTLFVAIFMAALLLLLLSETAARDLAQTSNSITEKSNEGVNPNERPFYDNAQFGGGFPGYGGGYPGYGGGGFPGYGGGYPRFRGGYPGGGRWGGYPGGGWGGYPGGGWGGRGRGRYRGGRGRWGGGYQGIGVENEPVN